MKIKDYFKSRPYLSVTTILIIIVASRFAIFPFMSFFYMPFLIGANYQSADLNQTKAIFDNTSITLAKGFTNTMQQMFIVGQRFNKIGFIVSMAFYGIMWTIVISYITLIIYIIRIIIYYSFTTKKERLKNLIKELKNEEKSNNVQSK